MSRKAKIEAVLERYGIGHYPEMVKAISRLIYNEGAEYREGAIEATQKAIKYKNQRDVLIDYMSESVLCSDPHVSSKCPEHGECKVCWLEFVGGE